MERFFAPESVVLIGTSRQTGPGAYNNLETLLRYGYQGRIYLVHPKVPEILGYKAYPNLVALPEAPDLAIISLGRERVVPAARDCVQRGVKRLLVISQGFADADARGQELQTELVGVARDHGARVLGPNTMGIINPFAAFNSAFIDVPRDPSPAPLTIVAQSGAFQVGYSSFTGRMGRAIDVGNACDLDVVDVLEFLENDPQTRIIVLHLEGVRRGRMLLQTAARIARRKPIIALKTGRSPAGAQAVLSHTGSLVGADPLVDLAFAQAGIIRVRNLVELRAVCRAFLSYRPMQGPGLGVVSATGAFGIIAADACEDYGLELAPFPEKLRSLEEERIPWHRLHNPVDLWPLGMVTGSFTGVFQRAVAGLLEDDQVHAVLGVAPAFTSPLHADLDIPGAIRKLQAQNPLEKPLALLLYGEEAARRAQDRDLAGEPGVACFDSMDEAVMGLAATWRYQEFLRKEVGPEEFALPPAPVDRALGLPSGVVVGEPALNLLSTYGIAAAPGGLVRDPARAAVAANELGYPVVLKIVSPQWLHKSDWGGVCLHINDESALLKSYQELEDLFGQKTPYGRLDGILVQKEVQGIELLLGLKRDPQFGPVLVAAAGGIYTEIMKDVAWSLVPVSEAEAARMLEALKIYPILHGVRGQAGADLSSLAASLVRLSRLAVDYPEIRELDLNPVIVGPQGCWAVDCRIVLD